MILQQNQPNKIWGWATPGEKVNVHFMQKDYPAFTNRNGEWKILLAPIKGGQGGNMIISSGTQTKIIKNVLAGEVWLCSGQSNMEYPMWGFKERYKNEIGAANDKDLRYIVMKNSFDNKESNDVELKNSWVSIDSSTVLNCSAVAYFFAKKLRDKLNVPVGLIISSWGGTPAQAWVDVNTLNEFPNYKELYDKSISTINFAEINDIRKKNQETFNIGFINSLASFKNMRQPGYNDSGWAQVDIPKSWEYQGYPGLDGVAAYRIKLTIPVELNGKSAELHMPGIDDADSTYVNGTFVGSGNVWNEKRIYKIPANILKTGENVIAIWVNDTGGDGGIQNDPENFYVQVGSLKIALKGKASFKVLAALENITPGVNFASLQNQPAVLFNAMIAPLLSYGIKGVTWYQGESNVEEYKEYGKLFTALINNWRKRFEQKELPFLFVQLSSYNPIITEPAESKWAGLREAQASALKLPKTGMAVSIDVGDQIDIHPQRKKEVGERLAANAINIVYGFNNEIAAGPIYKTSIKDERSLKISYDNIGNGLMQNGEKLLGFTIAGADKKFVPAKAVIKGDEVVVSNATISAPFYVRYAWADAPMDANLYNKNGFPAAPFRTDK